MAIVQQATADQTSTGGPPGTVTLSFPGATTPGNTIIVALRLGNNPTSTAAITDGSNTYGTDTSTGHSSFGTLYIFSCSNAQSVTTLTCTVSGANTTVRWAIYEYSGLATAAIDRATSQYIAAGPTGSVDSGLTLTTTQANELLFGAIAYNTNETATAGTSQSYVLEAQIPAGPSTRLAVEDCVVSATGTYKADFLNVTGGSDHICAIATYKTASGVTDGNKTIPRQSFARRPGPYQPMGDTFYRSRFH